MLTLLFSLFISTSIAINCPDSSNSCGPCTGLSGTDNCVLDCVNGQDHCKEDTLTCTTGHPCIVTCIGFDTCFEGTLNANQATYLILNCGDDSGSNDGDCWGLTVDATSTTDVTVHCTDSDGRACHGMVLKCGTGNCQINCEGDSCESVTIDATLSSQYTCSGGGCNQIPPTSVQTSPPTTAAPTTTAPTTAAPTTTAPTTTAPTTNTPTTNNPTTNNPTTNTPTTMNPTTNNPTTVIPTTYNPTTVIPTTHIPTTAMPTTVAPTTAMPTTTSPTTSFPTMRPTDEKQCDDRYNAMLSVAFDYKNRNNVELNVIRNILSNISNEYVTKISVNISSHCVIDHYTKSIDISHGANNAIINISMCLDCHMQVNTQDLFDKQKLQTDFIIVFESETDVINVAENSTEIHVDIIDQEVEIDTTYIVESIDNDKEYNDENSNNLLGNILYIGIGFGTTCICITCCIVIYNRRQKKYIMNENNMKQNKFGTSQKMHSVNSVSVNNSPEVNLTEMVKHSVDHYIVPGSPQTTDLAIGTMENNSEPMGDRGEGSNDPYNDPIIMNDEDEDDDVLGDIETIGQTIQ